LTHDGHDIATGRLLPRSRERCGADGGYSGLGRACGLPGLVLNALALLVALCLLCAPAAAQDLEAGRGVDVLQLAAQRHADGLDIDYSLRVSLATTVEDALLRGVPLYFTASATLFRPRWYWRDELVAGASRSWRLSYQPLTSTYRISLGGLHQSYERLPEALSAMSSASHWRIADAPLLEPGQRYYLEFEWRLDNSQLPRPMQIGIGSQPGWDLAVERTLDIE
jgi:hypothetical protein